MNRYGSLFFLLLLTVCSGRGARADTRPSFGFSQEIVLHADQLRLDLNGERIVAKGSCELMSGNLKITASLLILDIPNSVAEIYTPTVLGQGDLVLVSSHLLLNLESGALELDEPELNFPKEGSPLALAKAKSALCEGGSCRLLDAAATACPHKPHGYRIRAEEVFIHNSGDVDLRRPVLEIGETPVAALPWIRLRPAGSAGFLPPRLGWDAKGGLIIGPAGYVPLGKNVSLEGYSAVRTAEGFESSTRLRAPHLDLTLDHLFDRPDNSIRIRGRTANILTRASWAADIDITTDRRIIDGLATSPLERSVTHTVSRSLLSTKMNGVIIETYAELLQSFDRHGWIVDDALTPKASIELALPSTPIAGFFWPSLDLKFTRLGAVTTDLSPDASSSLAPGHSRLELSYGLELPRRLGPLGAEIRAAGRHQAWLPDEAGEPGSTIHLASMDMYLSVPLARNFNTFKHRVEPFVRYLITPWLEGSTPTWVVDGFDQLRRGQGLEVGLTTSLGLGSLSPAGLLEIKERFDMPGFGAEPGAAYTAASGSVGPSWFTMRVDVSWDHTQKEPSTAGLSIMSRHGHTNSVEIGARWIGPGRGPHMDQPFSSVSGPWLTTLWPTWVNTRMEIFEELKMALSQRMSAFAGARLGVWPNEALHALWYGLELHSSCGCLSAGISASHRLNTLVPDVMATLRFLEI
ncbi:MAG: LPS-assembly protein LptD [Proteobacteria bacterium]|nr:LPS-assembly protein LptD [Pseudomonadota bacterium]